MVALYHLFHDDTREILDSGFYRNHDEAAVNLLNRHAAAAKDAGVEDPYVTVAHEYEEGTLTVIEEADFH